MARVLRSRSILAAAVAALVLVGVAGLAIGQAEPRPDLPAVPPDRLIASALSAIAERTPLSGTVTTHVDLGIPQVPGNLNDPAGPLGVLLADQTFKVWSSPNGARVAQILPFAERDVVANGSDVWYWDSSLYTAWHLAVPPGIGPPQAPSLGDLEAIVGKALRAVAPYADVSTSDPTVVAGRDAYVVRLTPISPDTLIGRIEVAIDAQTRVPLRMQVFPKTGASPSIEAGFISVAFGPVDPSMFAFKPPEGATVKEVAPPADHGGEPPGAGPPEVRTFGEGFGLIVAVRVTDVPKDLRPLFPYAGPLGSADLVVRGDHAWLVVGAVPPDALAGVESNLP
jgi:outer membrane lipoprotein-sorting protein